MSARNSTRSRIACRTLTGKRTAVLLAALAIVAGCTDEQRQANWVPVVHGEFEITRTEDGELAALNSMTISSRIRGQIEFIAKDLENVEKGDVLVELEKTELQNELKRAEDDLAASEKRFAESKRSLEVESGQLLVDKERKRAALGLAEVRLESVEAGAVSSTLSIAEKDLEATRAALAFTEDSVRDAMALAEKGFATEEELDSRRLERERAFVAVEKARMRLGRYRAMPTPEDLRPAQLEVQKATLDLAVAQEQAKTQRANLEQSVAWAEAEVSRHQEHIRRTKEKLEATTIRAPRAGLVCRCRYNWERQKVDIGVRVWPAIGIVELPDLSRMKVKTQIPEALIRHFAVGDKVEVSVDLQEGGRKGDDGEQRYEGHIIWIDSWARDKNAKLAEADQKREGLSGIRVFTAEVELDATDERLRMGTRARVVLTKTLTDVLSVDRRAVWSGGGEHYVKELLPDGSTRMVPVVLGEMNEERAEVVEGVERDAKVLLRNGM